jgi:NADPH:quinone reductase
MRLIDHGSGGDASVLKLSQGPIPQPKPNEVLIKAAYVGINRPDVLQRSGKYPPPPGASPTIGLEVSGEIVAMGSEASAFAHAGVTLGSQVCALTNGGSYAEYVCAPIGQVLPVPAGLSMLQAAALPENYFTVWTNVIERGRLEAGETLLIHGGSSGIGITAIQMAKAWGAKVIVTVGSADKAAACLKLGADHAINYREKDFVAEVTELTNKIGPQLILDMVGGDYVARNLKTVALEGRIVQIAFLQPSKMEIDLMPIMIKRLTFTGSTLRPRTDAEKARIAAALRTHIWPRLERQQMLPVIYKVFDLADASQGHALMESSSHIGKIMLKV